MKIFAAIVSVFLSVTNVGGKDCRIIGGNNAEEGQFPFQISLQKDGQHYCGGSIINSRWILTATHCLFNNHGRKVVIIAGSTKLSQGGHKYKLAGLIRHGGYNDKTLINDIGLLKTRAPIRFSHKVRPIKLSRTYIGGGEDVFVSGWGRIKDNSHTDNLQFILDNTITNKQCRHAGFTKPITDNHLCTYTKKGLGSCKGDSGGPLIHWGNLVGIVSWGKGCGLGYPDVNTRVSQYLDWIAEAIRQTNITRRYRNT